MARSSSVIGLDVTVANLTLQLHAIFCAGEFDIAEVTVPFPAISRQHVLLDLCQLLSRLRSGWCTHIVLCQISPKGRVPTGRGSHVGSSTGGI